MSSSFTAESYYDYLLETLQSQPRSKVHSQSSKSAVEKTISVQSAFSKFRKTFICRLILFFFFLFIMIDWKPSVSRETKKHYGAFKGKNEHFMPALMRNVQLFDNWAKFIKFYLLVSF